MKERQVDSHWTDERRTTVFVEESTAGVVQLNVAVAIGVDDVVEVVAWSAAVIVFFVDLSRK